MFIQKKRGNAMKTIRVLIAAGLPLFVLPSGALAGDAKVLPGTMCQRVAGEVAGTYFRGSYRGAAQPAEGQLVNCPILRESSSSVLGEVKVRAGNDFESSNVRCRVFSQADDGSDYDQTEELTHLATGFKELRFVIDGLDHFSGGTFSVNCSMGDDDEIRSIRYTED
jgi:hypothetical protein